MSSPPTLDLTHAEVLGQPLALRCGAVLSNRLAKAAMSEHLARRDGAPSDRLIGAYRRWARSGAGLL